MGDPISSQNDFKQITANFLNYYRKPFLTFLSEKGAEAIRELGFKINCMGVEPEIKIQDYNTKGDWKELDMIRRARNEAKRNNITIEEIGMEKIARSEFEELSKGWLAGKNLNDREIWLYARRPVFENEEDVRKFIARNKNGNLVGFTFFDPLYSQGQIVGYAPNICRFDEDKFGKLSVAVNMTAAEIFKKEGKEIMNLSLSPFDKIDVGRFNDDKLTKNFLKLLRKHGEKVYNFGGLSFHKSGYKTKENAVYIASKSIFPINEIYLAFGAAGITSSYISLIRKLGSGLIKDTYKTISK